MIAKQNAGQSGTVEGLPLIDISGIRTADRRRLQQIADEIGLAAREIGFFRLIGHGIDLGLVEQVYQEAERFFSMPDEYKRRYYIGLSSNHRGYVPFTEKGDYPDEVNRSYEAFDMGVDLPHDDPDYLAGNRLLGPNVWPDVPGFKETVANYYGQISALGRLISSVLELHLGLPPGSMTSQMTKPISQLRLLHYVRRNNQVDTKSVNMGAHTDYECLTLLHTRNAGLQVMTAEDRWIDVPVDHRVYVVNIGDMMEAWTNGLFRSTPHRVLNLMPERFSMPYFVAANYGTVISPFPQLLGADGQSQYEPFRAGDHLERMLIRDFPYLRKQGQGGSAEGGQSVENPFEKRMNRSST
ncbi:isopenicillin N synthase family oxygenase [Donghicola sp. C2-DW-16]|uniref:Isopenicillin N synthase family oxygenase n=1 Tax=Donghicola mangrovi TaxID=2729614 RepID=A0A850Q713_9RHOB|nr:isopenicillin N synthase family oxygenase [Donghicola mangrovi]NVO24743.1 isopenicillin N synthase family oxygenase [Donghicola mangrovi]NVO29004.1 isopenicillin N synthase family oxygenase [Donghicola mangrovi]